MALAKKQIREIKQKHGYEEELKWTNISDKTFALYNEIVDYFFMTNMKFRAVIVDKSEIDNTRAEYSYNDFIFGCITSYCIIKWTWTAPITSISTSRTHAANGNYIRRRRYWNTIRLYGTSIFPESHQVHFIQLADTFLWNDKPSPTHPAGNRWGKVRAKRLIVEEIKKQTNLSLLYHYRWRTRSSTFSLSTCKSKPMPFNLLKKYPEATGNPAFGETRAQRLHYIGCIAGTSKTTKRSSFREKRVYPIKSDGEIDMQREFMHLTTTDDKGSGRRCDEKRVFEPDRFPRLHWIRHHIEERTSHVLEIFSCEERDMKHQKNIYRTYVYDMAGMWSSSNHSNGYYLLTAYYLNMPGGEKEDEKKCWKEVGGSAI